MRKIKCMALAIAASCAVASATPITVINGGFNADGAAKITDGFGSITGWSNTGTTYSDSGHENGNAYAKASDDGGYQILNYAMVEGEKYTLEWDDRNSGGGADQSTITLLSAANLGDAFSATSTLISQNIALAGWTHHSFEYTAVAADAGNLIGISFDNTSATGNSWANWDNFAVDAIPEPATLGIVALFGGGILFIRRKLML